ncbi:hypothetical protein AKJ37_03210 [candidate division MSBL1 archaeon SCGC-AAA259I09]|uniref:4Fe-4S ferredoxin-type domain-containing protein n=1 Tax=candidate division MSBL1 archaeon SCGC-AAA259I09 TaxID=1698267 RepID=A0A133USW5_9EURY|nr:hypothetical protein AKJ37_03210 [candidate division MSBL1 archaeon SCGC-AAA259I09]
MSESSEAENEQWRKTGILRPEDVDLPDEGKLEDNAIAVIECPQKIPCNPCEENCPVGAIKLEDLNAIPKVDTYNSTGCSICVQQCPGLAIFMVEYTGDDKCEITIPYEFELPEEGEEIEALNRKGEKVCIGNVTDTLPREKSVGDTPTLTIEVPREFANIVRSIRRKNR